jgi:hypothetical protein
MISSPRPLRRVANGAVLTSVVLAGAVALAGCTSMAMAATPPASWSSTVPSTVPTMPPATPEPARVLDGSCSTLFPETVFSDAAVRDALGESVAEYAPFLDAPNLHAVPTLGGLDCHWRAAGGYSGAASVTAVVLAGSLTDTNDSVTCEAGAVTMDPEGASACRFEFTAGGLWLSGHVVPRPGTAESDTRAAVAALGDAFRALPPRGSGTVPLPAALPDGAWLPPHCAELADAAAVTVTLASPDLLVSDLQTSGSESVPGVHAANGAAGVFACAWFRSGDEPAGAVDGFSVLALPGGAWAQSRVLAVPGAEVVDLPGVDLAVRMPTAEGHDLIDVFDGVNWMQLGGLGSLDAVLPVVPDLVDALDAQRGH